MFFDASLLWEPDWLNSTPLELRKTRVLALPSWSWMRARGSIETEVWRKFAQDFYKDASFKETFELTPRVQWWKIKSRGGASKLIQYQHFSNHASMPPGWKSSMMVPRDKHRSDIVYFHTVSTDRGYEYPFPLPESAEAHVPDVEYGPLLRCIANRAWLVKSDEFEEPGPNKFHGTLYGAFNLCLGDGTWAGILFDDRLDTSFPQKSSERREVIAIAEGRFRGEYDTWVLPEYSMGWSRRDAGYEFYFVLWIGWLGGIAYRRGIGRVLKRVWEKMELEEIEVVLG
ncbi:hypothetical protein THARTR1_04673 [Trichoderma harzianum]|uniref:Heterokaryon incompatibility domain-containing protein n=1 Tax=Trichoderma harzianum TaxID=5544 RepID=A0A2K0UB50_TRIHA|nr:hypothetical protein THARTR1_04673 [Trichoderma harzianum]